MLKLTFITLSLLGAVNLSDVTYYEILGVSKQASSLEIKQAYKKLVVIFHPDKNPGEEKQEKFLKITEAYETLKDQEKRRNYDLYGSHTSYSRKYDYRSQSEYDNLFYNGLYHNDPFVDTLSGANFYSYLTEGFYFINFYSPFCPPCQNVADDWKKLAEVYKGIIKVGAVNCKYHNSFCYNSMRIGSYPSLLFYPNGKNGNYIHYRGDRSLEGLDQFVMTYLKTHIHVPTVSQLRNTEKPMAYVLGTNMIDISTLTRIAFHLNGLVSVVVVEDDGLRDKLTTNDYATIVFKYRSTKEIESTDEKEILKQIVESLPKVEPIDPNKLKDIRNQLRNGVEIPWALYFSTSGESKLELYQMRILFPDINFGEINCDKWAELCASLQVESAPAWGVMKSGGGYQRAASAGGAREFLRTAPLAHRLHTLSASDLTRILNTGTDAGVWVLLVVPHQTSWEDILEPFTQASLHFDDDDNINFGIMMCTLNTDKYCQQVAQGQATILVQNGTSRHVYAAPPARLAPPHLIHFIRMLRDAAVMELSEQQVLEILEAGRSQCWVVAFLPPHCGRPCDQLAHEWLLVADKLRPLRSVRVGVLRCARADGFCANVRAPTARLYPVASPTHYSVSLQHVAQAPYMLEWALRHIDDSVRTLAWQTFTRTVIAEELNPTGGKKPWLVYFHSPRCYRCYEMYADFAIAGNLLNNAVHLGKVNCVSERSLCQHEQITKYPSLKLYLNRNQHQRFSSVISVQVGDYESVLQEIRPYLLNYDENLLAGVDSLIKEGIRHDEF